MLKDIKTLLQNRLKKNKLLLYCQMALLVKEIIGRDSFLISFSRGVLKVKVPLGKRANLVLKKDQLLQELNVKSGQKIKRLYFEE